MHLLGVCVSSARVLGGRLQTAPAFLALFSPQAEACPGEARYRHRSSAVAAAASATGRPSSLPRAVSAMGNGVR